MRKMTYTQWQAELEDLFHEWLWTTNPLKEKYIMAQVKRLHREHWFFSFLEKIDF